MSRWSLLIFQVSRSKVNVKGHVGLQHLVQQISQEHFAPEASNLVGRKSLMNRMTPINIQVSRWKANVKGQPYSWYVGEGWH